MVAIRSTSLIFTSVTLLASYVSAYGQIAQVVDAKNFCVFLPPSDSVDRGIADTEWNAQAFCIGKAPLAKNAGKLDSGFIRSAHYLATDKYVQVTGKIDPSKARLNVTDEGGQYDIKAPKGSSCAGWKFYVNLVEPAGNTYCMRCCNDDRSCNRGISEKGCAHIIPGDYSGPEISKPATNKSTSSKKSTTTKTTTTTTVKKTTTSKTIPTTTIADAANATHAAGDNNNKVADSANATRATDDNNDEANQDKSSPVPPAANANQDKSSNTETTTPVPAADNATPVAGDDTESAKTTPDTPLSTETTTVVPPVINTGLSSPTGIPGSSDAVSAGSSSQPGKMLSQNDNVSEQSISGAEKSHPSMIAMTIALVVMAMMYQQ